MFYIDVPIEAAAVLEVFLAAVALQVGVAISSHFDDTESVTIYKVEQQRLVKYTSWVSSSHILLLIHLSTLHL